MEKKKNILRQSIDHKRKNFHNASQEDNEGLVNAIELAYFDMTETSALLMKQSHQKWSLWLYPGMVTDAISFDINENQNICVIKSSLARNFDAVEKAKIISLQKEK